MTKEVRKVSPAVRKSLGSEEKCSKVIKVGEFHRPKFELVDIDGLTGRAITLKSSSCELHLFVV